METPLLHGALLNYRATRSYLVTRIEPPRFRFQNRIKGVNQGRYTSWALNKEQEATTNTFNSKQGPQWGWTWKTNRTRDQRTSPAIDCKNQGTAELRWKSCSLPWEMDSNNMNQLSVSWGKTLQSYTCRLRRTWFRSLLDHWSNLSLQAANWVLEILPSICENQSPTSDWQTSKMLSWNLKHKHYKLQSTNLQKSESNLQ